MERSSNLAKVAKQVAITSAELKEVGGKKGGYLWKGNSGKGISHKRGADPPKNPLGMTGPFTSPDESRRRVNIENGSSIAANSFPGILGARYAEIDMTHDRVVLVVRKRCSVCAVCREVAGRDGVAMRIYVPLSADLVCATPSRVVSGLKSATRLDEAKYFGNMSSGSIVALPSPVSEPLYGPSVGIEGVREQTGRYSITITQQRERTGDGYSIKPHDGRHEDLLISELRAMGQCGEKEDRHPMHAEKAMQRIRRANPLYS
ncbi:hypothetical protein BJY52DRAFT_1418391 [Lactarius psammicola]|nr:hypothetical protein BJY52DRAFT_1418391 [Lactarius psammicola]